LPQRSVRTNVVIVASLVSDLLDLVLPHRCPGCGRPGELLCGQCAEMDAWPLTREVGGHRVVAAGEYRDGLRAALIAYKERNRRGLVGPLGRLLAASVDELGLARGSFVLVPVPSARAVARARGGDHMGRLATAASGILGVPVVRGLSLRRSVQDSAGLDTADRLRNLSGAMCSRAAPDGEVTAVVLDDIVTTGATLKEATRSLDEAGWAVGGAAVVASTERHGSARAPAGARSTAFAVKW
jgi:predicted amidophosphoribosyltransferase